MDAVQRLREGRPWLDATTTNVYAGPAANGMNPKSVSGGDGLMDGRMEISKWTHTYV